METNLKQIIMVLEALGFENAYGRHSIEYFNTSHWISFTSNSLRIQSRHQDDDRGYFWHEDVSMKIGQPLTATMLLAFLDVFDVIPMELPIVQKAYALTETIKVIPDCPTLMRYAV